MERQNRNPNRKPKKTGPKPAKDVERVYGYLVWYLGKYGEASEKTLREKLTRITDNQEWIDSAINKVIEQGYQSDSRFAEIIVRKGLGSKAWGKSRIEQEMKRKGLSSDVIEEALTALNDDDPLARAQEAIDKKFRDKAIKEQKELAKATRFLASRGFGFGVISSAIKAHNEEIESQE